MPDIHFECPKCSQTLDAPEELATQLINCPACKETIEVPLRSQRTEPPKPPKPAVTPPSPAPPQPLPSRPTAASRQTSFRSITTGQGTAIIVLLILALLVFPFFHSLLSGVLPSQEWEYCLVSIPDYSFETKINALGADGWELVFARRASDGSEIRATMSYEMIFKRPKRLL